MAVKEWCVLPRNPVAKISRPPRPKGRVRYLTPEDEKPRLLEACKEVDDRLYFLVCMALATGARKGELLSLRWREVDFKLETVTFLHTKNGTDRSVPLTGEALDLARKAAQDRLPTELVFATPLTRRNTRKASFPRKAWARAREKAGLADFVFHDLRHTHASYLAMSGATIREIAYALGHRTLDMVIRYSHLTPNHNRKIVKRMTKQFLD